MEIRTKFYGKEAKALVSALGFNDDAEGKLLATGKAVMATFTAKSVEGHDVVEMAFEV